MPALCPPVDPANQHVLAKDQLKLISAAGKKMVVKQGTGAYRLEAVGGGRMAVQSADEITVLASNGDVLATVLTVQRDAPRALALSKRWLAVERKSTLDFIDPANGVEGPSFSLGTAAPLRLARRQREARRAPQREQARARSPERRQATVGHPRAKADRRREAHGSRLFYAYNSRARPPKGGSSSSRPRNYSRVSNDRSADGDLPEAS